MLRSDLIKPIAVLLERHAAAKGSQVAFEDAARAVTWSEVCGRTANIAGHLADLGIRSGDCVAVYLPNSVDWVEAVLGVVRAGGVAVPVSIDSTESEVAYRLRDANCRAVFTLCERLEAVERLRAEAPSVETVIITRPIARTPAPAGPTLDSFAETVSTSSPRDPLDIDATAFLVYTSGTTGQAKGVQLSCRGMLWVTAACWAPILGLDGDDRVLSPLPLFHSYALNLCVMSIVATGASIFLMEKFSTKEAVARLSEGDFTVFPAVPTIFHYLLETARSGESINLCGMKACITAGAIMPGALNKEFESRFGVPLLDGYGITETSTMVTMNSASSERVPGSCGLPLPGLAVRIVHPESLLDCDPGEEGELIVRGPNVMLGYLNKPEETAKALRNGWYHTGDLAKADRNGFVTITGRIKELIIRGGQNIAPAEVEEVVLKLDCIVDCAAVGLPHASLGEVVGLFVIARDEGFNEQLVLDHCRQHLSSYKVPAAIHIVDAIPRTGSGKIIRFRLREQVAVR